MKRSALSLHATRMAALALALGTLAGCDTLNDWF
jgi:outer membrane protein assembly factor BamC